MKNIPLTLKLDKRADAGYIKIAKRSPKGSAVTQIRVEDERLRGYVVIDLDEHDRLLGIELIAFKTMLEGNTR